MKEDRIIISHGTGGKLMHRLIGEIFLREFKNEIIEKLTDSAVIDFENFDICFTTDSYTIDPIFFPGGDIGKLSICGTVNDLSVCGAIPMFLSCSFILEEGFEIENLKKIVKSMKDQAEKIPVKIVTGDTKVVEKGKADKIFINTSGIGIKRKDIKLGTEFIKEGDLVIINGSIGEHGLATLLSREKFNFEFNFKSDCCALNKLIYDLIENCKGIKFMRDPTRGGIAATLNEIVNNRNFGILIYEERVPVKEEVKAICEILGFDPFIIANEGKVIVVVDRDEGEKVVEIMKRYEEGKDAEIIGEIVDEPEGKVLVKTQIGSKRILDMPSGEQFPRIC